MLMTNVQIFEEYYKQYDEWYEKNKAAYLSEVAALKKAVPKKGKGLEIGVGTGRFASKLGIKYGADPSRKMLRLARKRGVETKLGFAEDLPYQDEHFDYVLINITLCFVNDHLRALKEAKRTLKKHGKIIIGIIDKNSFLGDFYQNKQSKFYDQARFFSVEDILGLLKSESFKDFSTFQTIYKLPQYVDLLEKPLHGWGKGGFVVISATKG